METCYNYCAVSRRAVNTSTSLRLELTRGCLSLRDGNKLVKSDLAPTCYNFKNFADLNKLFPTTAEAVRAELQLSPVLAHEVRLCKYDRCNRLYGTYCPSTKRKQTYFYANILRRLNREKKKTAKDGESSANRNVLSRVLNVLSMLILVVIGTL